MSEEKKPGSSEVEKPDSSEEGKKGSLLSKIGKESIQSNQAVAKLAMVNAQPWQRIIVYCCYGVISLALIGLFIPPYEANKQLTIVIFVVISLLVAIGMMIWSSGGRKTSSEEKKNQNVQLTPLTFDKLHQILEEARNQVWEILRKKYPKLADAQVRANIFFPEYHSSRNDQDYILKIYPGLHLNMDRPKEIGIPLKPGQGSTGVVFSTGTHRVTERLKEGSEGDWDATYKITDDLAAIIHPDLKWIISIPLKNEGGKPIAVLNIDGLKESIPVDALYFCLREITLTIITIQALIQKNA